MLSQPVLISGQDNNVPDSNEMYADSAEQQNKMFVGGLAQTVTSDSLRDYFSTFGPVQEAFVLMDDQSGRSRGFGFVTFEHANSLNQVLKQKPHVLGNKQVDCKHAVTKNVNRQRGKNTNAIPATQSLTSARESIQQFPMLEPAVPNAWATAHDARVFDEEMIPNDGIIIKDEVSPVQPNGEYSDTESPEIYLTGGGKSYLALSGDKWLEDCEEADARKIFVGGLPDIAPAEFATYFEHFGPVADAMVMFDRKRRRQRGFGFITFATNEGVRNALHYTRHPVKGKLVEVKKAHPLVLQNARAPAKRERDAALERMKNKQQNNNTNEYNPASQNSLTATLNHAERVAPPAAAVTASLNGKIDQNPIRSRDGELMMVDPFGLSAVRGPKMATFLQTNTETCRYPEAPWNQPALGGWLGE